MAISATTAKIGAATAVALAVTLVPGASAADAARNVHHIGRGVLDHVTSGGTAGGGSADYIGTGRLRGLGAGDWTYSFTYVCAFDAGCSMSTVFYFKPLSTAGDPGSFLVGSIHRTSATPDYGVPIDITGSGSLTQWSGQVSVTHRTVGHRDVYLFTGWLDHPR